MTDDEIIGVCRTFVKKMFAVATISTVTITQSVTSGNELADIDVSGTSSKVYMPTVKVNGVTQNVASNELDLDVAANLITEAQWSALETIFS